MKASRDNDVNFDGSSHADESSDEVDDEINNNNPGRYNDSSDDREYYSSPSPSPLPEANPIVSNTNNKGLHYRHTRNRRREDPSLASIDSCDESHHHQTNPQTGVWNGQYVSSDEKRKRRVGVGQTNRFVAAAFGPFNNANRRRAIFPIGKYIKSCLIAGIPAYMVGFLFFLYSSRNPSNIPVWDNDYRSLFLSNIEGLSSYSSGPIVSSSEEVVTVHPEFFQTVQELQISAYDLRQTRHSQLDEQEWDVAKRSGRVLYGKVTGRRHRLAPQTPVSDLSSLLPIYSIISSSDQDLDNIIGMQGKLSKPETSSKTPKNDKPAPLEELCGYFAQSASLESPTSFKHKDSLVKASRKVRVLITGILSTPVGYHLALTLKERCNVNVAIGFDNLYPNSLKNRLLYQEQMAILTKSIPRIVRPFFIGHVGLDPIKHASKNFQVLNATSELDIVQTFQPTHIVHLAYHNSDHSFNNVEYYNDQSPYRSQRTKYSEACIVNDSRTEYSYRSPLYVLKNSLISMEQILASIAKAPLEKRPHFIYASTSATTWHNGMENSVGCLSRSNVDHNVHIRARKMDEVLASFYYRKHKVYSIGMRIPFVYGPWDHPSSPVHQTIREQAGVPNADHQSITDLEGHEKRLDDTLYVDDVVDAVISAMQYRSDDSSEFPLVVGLSSGHKRDAQDIKLLSRELLKLTTRSNATTTMEELESHLSSRSVADETILFAEILNRTKRLLGWSPESSLAKGLANTIAWHLNRIQPYGPPPNNQSYHDNSIISGDRMLQRLSLPNCDRFGDALCHGGQPALPCASECALHKPYTCIPTAFDDILSLVQSLTQECDIVLYTQHFDKGASDLDLSSEFMEEGDPLVCNFAFINQDSNLTNSVIEKVPDQELKNLDFELLPGEDLNQPGSIRKRKYMALNGRLLYRGWILIWVKDLPDELHPYEESLLKLSPGRFFHSDVKTAVFIDQQFRVSPKADDIAFLAHEMYRKAWDPKVMKRKNGPKAKYLMPAEPERLAAILLPQLKYQDSVDAERLPPEEKISVYEATRFMRFEVGEKTPLGKEPHSIKMQREFYERVKTYLNPDNARSLSEPSYKFELKNWVRTRWVAHDMTTDASRLQVRCPWYEEHVLWGTPLDQVSFAYVIEKLDLQRRIVHNEPDESVQKDLVEKMEMKKSFSDTFEWIALETDANKQYSSFSELQVLPSTIEFVTDGKKQQIISENVQDFPHDVAHVNAVEGDAKDNKVEIRQHGHHHHQHKHPLFFVRIISDKVMAFARKAWNDDKKVHSKHHSSRQKHSK